jgi:hypothetical protein
MNDIVIIQPGEIVIDVVVEINHEYELSMAGMKNAVEHAYRCGQLLLEQQKKVEFGEWVIWIEANCTFKTSQAYAYMRLAKFRRAGILVNGNSIKESLRIISRADPKPKRLLPTPPAPMFTWFKEGLVQAMDAGVEAIQRAIPILSKTEQDQGVAIYILTMLRKSLAAILEDLDVILGEQA